MICTKKRIRPTPLYTAFVLAAANMATSSGSLQDEINEALLWLTC